MIELTLDGLVPSKKNNRRLWERGGRQFSAPSAQHEKWKNDQLADLPKKLTGFEMPIPIEPVYIAYMFYMPDYKRRDLSNMIQSIEDMLVGYGLFVDDAWKYLQIVGVMAKIGDPVRVEIAIEDEIEPLRKWLDNRA